jgi:hypothetical protein
MFRKILTTATVAVALTLGTTSRAQAGPVFLLPDVNFASALEGPGALFVTSPHNYIVTINTAVGDQMSIDRGEGFLPLKNSNVTLGVNTVTGALVLNLGGTLLPSTGNTGTMVASLLTTKLAENTTMPNAVDIFATWRVTNSTIPGFHVGELIGFDALGFNGHAGAGGTQNFQIKGDVAPIIPEPATLSLLLLGLPGIAGSVRRRLV